MPGSSVQSSSLLKRIGTLLALTIAFVLLAGVLIIVLGLITPSIPDAFGDPNLSAYLRNWSIVLVSVLLAVWVVDNLQEKSGWASLGFSTKNLARSILTGSATALLILTFCFLILVLGGWTSIVGHQFVAPAFFGWLIFFLIQPLAEEIMMRSFLQNHLHRLFGPWIGLLGSALVFAALHLGNNAFTWIAGLEIVAGGLLIGLLFLHTQNIWGAYAMHACWNFYQSTVLGFAVSGMDTYRLLSLKSEGPAWLTGGEFGLEGSILSLVLLIIAIALFWPARKQQVPALVYHEEAPTPLNQES